MPLTLQKLTAATVTSIVDLRIPGQEEPEKVTVTYRPGVLTGSLEGELRRYGDSGEGWAALVSKLVVSWDIESEPGKTVPIEFVPAKREKLRDALGNEQEVIAEPAHGALLELPVWILQNVIEGVKADLRPNPKSGGTSAASS